jgi:Mn2+/Fe2+ NRAMP family transporter
MAEAFRLLIPVPFAVLVVGFAGAIPLLEVFVNYDRYSLILYGVLAAAIAIGLGLNFVGIDPIRALYVSAILNGFAAPPLILLMLILSRSRRAELRTGLMLIALLVMSASAAVYLIGSLVG